METNKSQYTEHVQFNPQDLLAERGKTRAPFSITAMASQSLKEMSRNIRESAKSDRPHELSNVVDEALDMICTKLARILTQETVDLDSWQDIAGYATLVINEANKNNE